MKNTFHLLAFLLAFLALIAFSSCTKQNIEKDGVSGLQGSWSIDSERSKIFDYDARNTKVACGEDLHYSGEFVLENNGTGSFRVLATHCDTTYVIFQSTIEDLSLDYPGGEGRDEPYFHRYYGSYIVNGDVVQFHCWADPSSELLTKSTSTIFIHLNEKHDGSKNLNQLEIYDMELVLNRD